MRAQAVPRADVFPRVFELLRAEDSVDVSGDDQVAGAVIVQPRLVRSLLSAVNALRVRGLAQEAGCLVRTRSITGINVPLHPVGLVGLDGKLDPVTDIEFRRKAGQVRLNGAETYVECAGYLGVGQAVGDMYQNFFFPVRERCHRLGKPSHSRTLREGREQPRGHAGTDEGIPVGGCVNRLNHQFCPCVLKHKPARARPESIVYILVEIVSRDHDDRQRSLGLWSGQYAGGFDAIHFGHAYVKQADVGSESTRKGDRLAPVGGFSDYLDAGLVGQDNPEPGADEFLVVSD